MEPRLSVIIPTYKRTQSLERLLDKLNAQKKAPVEIVVIDQNEEGYFSGSLRQKLELVTWVHQPEPNASLARNNGFVHSNAPYLLFLDDDLVPDADFCARGVEIFKNHPDIKSFVPLVYSELGRDLALEYGKNKFLANHPSGNGIFLITETISAAVFFERSYYKKTGGFDELLFGFAKTSEDQEFFLRMRRNDMQLWLVPFLEIFHDEKVSGGCELRTAGYWNTRSKCMKALALRHLIHNTEPGTLSIVDKLQLARSSFLNRKGLTSGINNFIREIRLMNKSIRESRNFYEAHKKVYTSERIDFIHEREVESQVI